MHFGHTLRTLRKAAGLSLRSLARQIGVSPAYLSQVEHGTAPPPTEVRLQEIAGIFGVPPGYLTCLAGRVSPEALVFIQEVPEALAFMDAARKAGLGRAEFAALTAALSRGGPGALKDWLRQAGGRPAPRRVPPSRLAAALSEKLLWCRLDVERKVEILRVMAEGVGRIHRGIDSNVMLHRLIRREEDGSTGIGAGVAIPHATANELAGNVVTLATLARGIDFKAIDRVPVRVVVLIVGPDHAAPERLGLLARVARLVQQPDFAPDLLRARTRRELLDRVKKLDAKIP
ncbi:MAG: PTS sugar transporter subunit IIA [Planctomycetes bacterium]|nr:PTS sugar transporter subunit IIA [Planctomycetota bacterium]